MRKYDIEIADFNSAGIREAAAEIGATHMRNIATGVGATLYAIPQGSGEILVLNTNSEPVWESDEGFIETLEQYQIMQDSTPEEPA